MKSFDRATRQSRGNQGAGSPNKPSQSGFQNLAWMEVGLHRKPSVACPGKLPLMPRGRYISNRGRAICPFDLQVTLHSME